MQVAGRPSGQVITALCLLVLTTVYASQIFRLGLPFSNGVEPGASFLPIVLSLVMYVSAGRILAAELRQRSRPPARPEGSDHVPAIGFTGPAIVVVFTMLFAAGLDRAGYFASAGLYTFAVAFYFNYEETGRTARAAALAALTAATITAFGWLFFDRLFDLSLPGWSF